MTADELAVIRQRALSVAWAGPARTITEARSKGVPVHSALTPSDALTLLDALDRATALVGELRAELRNRVRYIEMPPQTAAMLLKRLSWEQPT